MTQFLSDWTRDFFALFSFLVTLAQIAMGAYNFFVLKEDRRRNGNGKINKTFETLKEALRATKSDISLSLWFFSIQLIVALVVSLLSALDAIYSDLLQEVFAFALIAYIGVFYAVGEVDNWIKRNKTPAECRYWRAHAWMFASLLGVIATLVLVIQPGEIAVLFVASQVIAIGMLFVICACYFIAEKMGIVS